MALSVVVPVYNEAENILPLLAEIDTALSAIEHEIIYVDDGSTDETGQQLDCALQRYAQLRVLRHARRSGQSTALYNGVHAARFPVIATLDGDGQNHPGDIPELYAKLKGDILMLAGWRQRRQDSRWRGHSSRLANAVRARLLRDHTPDTGCGLKVFYRDTFLALPYFDHMHRFLPALIQRMGGKVVSEPVRHRPRTQGVSKYGTWQRLAVGIVDLCGVLWLKKRTRLTTFEELSRER
ncbi:MAG: glycosyltransferase family 2 protein [Methylococcales bacterium]|nr:glycosyltransferase family 2 protein [Methylococcales bacterium]